MDGLDEHVPVRSLSQARSAHGDDVEGWLRLLRAYMVLGDKEQARAAADDARRALSSEPDKLKRFYDALKLFKRLVNIGDAKSLACHPASTTHRQMSPEEQEKAGVRPEAIRLSVGIEHVDDIIADLDQALHAAD